MFKSRWRSHILAVGLLVAVIAVVATNLAQSSNGKWWPGYGNGPDNSRYFASRQINKSNVNQLQVAWNYPSGDTSFGPIVARGVIYGRGRNGSLVAVEAKTGKELWTSQSLMAPAQNGRCRGVCDKRVGVGSLKTKQSLELGPGDPAPRQQ